MKFIVFNPTLCFDNLNYENELKDNQLGLEK